MSIPVSLKRKYAVIYAMATHKKPTRAFLRERSAFSCTSFSRCLQSLKRDYGMQILFIADGSGDTRQSGYYQIKNWGILDRKSFLDWYSANLEQVA